MQELGEGGQKANAQIAEYVKVLKTWDDRIVEVFAIAILTATTHDKLTLVCRFEPEPPSDVVGFFWLANLIVRDEFEESSKSLGLDMPIDLGLQLGSSIHLPGGEVINPAGYIKLWPPD